MKKNVKILIIVLAAAVVLAGLMCLLIFLPQSSDSDSEIDSGVDMTATTDEAGIHQAKIKTNSKGEIENNSYGTLMEYDPADISTIHVENEKGTLDITSYTPTDDDGETESTEYTLVGYEDFDLQSGIADEVASAASTIEFSKVMTLDSSKLADYGLDDPRDSVTVTYTDNTKALIYVGDDAPQSAGTYIKFGSEDTVYLVTTDAVSAFDYGVTDLISLTINDSASDTDSSQATSIKISGSNFPDTITLEPNDDGKNSASYIMTTPQKCYANESESSEVAGGIRGLYASSVKMVNPSDSQLKELGLKAPYAKLKAVYSDTTVSLIASQPDDDGNVYLMTDGGKVVYYLAATSVPWVTTSYEALLNEYVLYPKMSALSNVTVTVDGDEVYSFDLSTSEETTTDDDGSETTSTTTTVEYDGDEIDLATFQNFYESMAMVELADSDTSDSAGDEVLTVTYTYASDSSTDTVVYYKSSGSSRYLAELNGTAVGHAYYSKVNAVVKSVAETASAAATESSSETE